jgi:HD-GYP domain-containing protein (c-di-GMP phosphodiesterase class II)
MREHVSIGHGILISAELPVEAEWVLHHHERVDGAGYPTRLRGDDIPLQSRIIAVADAFEAMTGVRPYRASVTTAQALAELAKHIGTQFDGRCVHALVEVVDQQAAAAAVALVVPRTRHDVAPAAAAAHGLATT